MNQIKKSVLAVLAVLTLVSSFALAQGPAQRRVNYTINVAYKLRMGDYMLSPGRYVLYQVSMADPNQFALYAEDMTHSPVAMIRTTRIEYNATNYPSKTRMLLDMDESGNTADPVIRGWTIPGEDGWRILSVVSKNDRYLTHMK